MFISRYALSYSFILILVHLYKFIHLFIWFLVNRFEFLLFVGISSSFWRVEQQSGWEDFGGQVLWVRGNLIAAMATLSCGTWLTNHSFFSLSFFLLLFVSLYPSLSFYKRSGYIFQLGNSNDSNISLSKFNWEFCYLVEKLSNFRNPEVRLWWVNKFVHSKNLLNVLYTNCISILSVSTQDLWITSVHTVSNNQDVCR